MAIYSLNMVCDTNTQNLERTLAAQSGSWKKYCFQHSAVIRIQIDHVSGMLCTRTVSTNVVST